MKIVMVRHGQSESNVKRVLSGSNETPLTENGRKELIELRNRLNYPKTDIYIASPLSRCLDTFKTLYPNETLKRTDKDFIEIYFGGYEGKSFNDVNLDEFFVDFFEHKNDLDSEKYEDFYKRVSNGMLNVAKELKENNHNSATVVAHSTVIKVLVKKVNDIPHHEYRNIAMKNGQGYIFDVDLVDDELVFNSVEIIKDKDVLNNGK